MFLGIQESMQNYTRKIFYSFSRWCARSVQELENLENFKREKFRILFIPAYAKIDWNWMDLNLIMQKETIWTICKINDL